MSEKYCEAYFVRHGQTEWNIEGRVQGHTDIPLNKDGIREAQLLKQVLKDISFSAAFSSDLLRARQTANELISSFSNLPYYEATELRERNMGALDGKSFKEIDQLLHPFFTSPYSKNQDTYFNISWHAEIEKPATIFERVMNFLTPYLEIFNEKTVLIVSHGGVIRTFLDHLSFRPGERWIIENCGFIKLKISSHQLQLLDTHRVWTQSIL